MGSTTAGQVRRAVEALNAGLLVVLPTDTVYGVAARHDQPAAVARLFEAKGREGNKPLPILVSSRGAAEMIGRLTPAGLALADAFWPGPLTIVTAVDPAFQSDALAGERTVGLRMPNQLMALALIGTAGGSLAVSSANRSGGPDPLSIDDARNQLGDAVAVYIDSGPAPDVRGSTVVDATTDRVRVLRAGPVSQEQIRTVLDG